MDPITIGTAVTGAFAAGGHVLSLLKSTAESVKSLGRAEVVNDLIEVQLALMELLRKQQELIEENRVLREQVSELTEALKTKAKLELHYDAYWSRLDDGKLDGPFAPQPWEAERKLLRMRNFGRDMYDGRQKVRYYCPVSEENIYAPVSFLRENNVQSEMETRADGGKA